MSIKLEEFVPVVKMHGLNTDKAVVLGSTLNVTGVITAASLNAVTFTATSVATTAGITSSGATGNGIGYATGAGGTVTQITSQSTGVTLSKYCGSVQLFATVSIAAEGVQDIVVTNTLVAVGDVVNVCFRSGTNGGNTNISVAVVAAGSFTVRIQNGNVAAGTAETGGAIIFNFAVLKAVTA